MSSTSLQSRNSLGSEQSPLYYYILHQKDRPSVAKKSILRQSLMEGPPHGKPGSSFREKKSCQKEMRTWQRERDRLLGGHAEVEGVCGRGRGEAMGRRETLNKREEVEVNI